MWTDDTYILNSKTNNGHPREEKVHDINQGCDSIAV